MSASFAVANSNNEFVLVDNVLINNITAKLRSIGWYVVVDTKSFEMQYFLKGVEKSKDDYFAEFQAEYQKVNKFN